MKKVLIVAGVFLLLCVTSSAFAKKSNSFYSKNSKTFYDGVNILDVGVGFGWYGGTSGLDMKIPPLVITYDRGLFIKGLPLSLGGVFGVAQYGKSFDMPPAGSYELTATYFVFGLRAAWHIDLKIKNLDLYGGFSLGAYYQKAEVDDSSFGNLAVSETSFYGGVFAGVHYYFTDIIGAFAEVGYDIGYFKFGLAVKF